MQPFEDLLEYESFSLRLAAPEAISSLPMLLQGVDRPRLHGMRRSLLQVRARSGLTSSCGSAVGMS